MARAGELEQRILDLLWERGELSVREVRGLLEDHRDDGARPPSR